MQNNKLNRLKIIYYSFFSFVTSCALFFSGAASADNFSGGTTIGGVAGAVTSSFTNLAKLITAGAYIAGLGFALSALLKFKQHKDNPQQIPIGTPIALLFIGAALVFLPTILGVANQTMFSGQGTIGGPSGVTG